MERRRVGFKRSLMPLTIQVATPEQGTPLTKAARQAQANAFRHRQARKNETLLANSMQSQLERLPDRHSGRHRQVEMAMALLPAESSTPAMSPLQSPHGFAAEREAHYYGRGGSAIRSTPNAAGSSPELQSGGRRDQGSCGFSGRAFRFVEAGLGCCFPQSFG